MIIHKKENWYESLFELFTSHGLTLTQTEISDIINEVHTVSEVDTDRVFKEGKKAGSKSMAKLVKQMREAQNRYFQTRSNEALRESKKLEEQVDRAVEAVLK